MVSPPPSPVHPALTAPPSQRNPEAKSYSPPFDLAKPLMTLGVAEVLQASPDATFKVGQHVLGYLPMAEYFTVGNDQAKGLKFLENKENLPWSTWIGAAGMPGRTAFYGFYEIGKPKKGETIFGEYSFPQ